MKISLKAKRILCCVLTAALLAVSLCGLSALLENKASKAQFERFYKSETGYDVLFFGASHMQNALNPIILWQECGIASYNAAFGSARMSYGYWIAKNSFPDRQPSLVVIDCAYLTNDGSTLPHTGQAMWLLMRCL